MWEQISLAIKEASQGPLGILALIIIVIALLAHFLFHKDSEKIKIIVFTTVFIFLSSVVINILTYKVPNIPEGTIIANVIAPFKVTTSDDKIIKNDNETKNHKNAAKNDISYTAVKAMTNGNFIANVALNSGLSLQETEKVINAMFEYIKKSLADGEAVPIVGFGTFAAVKRSASKGRNPRTGEIIQFPATVQPKFKAGKDLKDAVNQVDN